MKNISIIKNRLDKKLDIPTYVKKITNISTNSTLNYIYQKDFEESEDLLKKLHDIHKGERCFIIGTGPSLNKTDLSMLADETIFGVNTFHRFLRGKNIHCKYYCLSDDKALKDNYTNISSMNTTLFIGAAGAIHFIENKHRYKKIDPILVKRRGDLSVWKNISEDITKGTYVSGTVILDMCLQIAYYMGFKETYLVGCDCDYSGFTHFNGKILVTPPDRVKSWFEGYKIMKNIFEKNGRKIYNATVGGKLEIFERKKLEKIFSN